MLYGDPWDLSSSCSQHVLREMHHQSSTEMLPIVVLVLGVVIKQIAKPHLLRSALMT